MMKAPTARQGDTTRCGGCDELISVQWDDDGAYVDCPECGNYGYLW
jgi:predicted RNA-binding Zn-ribbon protein involved in translation (DUF1610 family)